mmetsp:Transcript_48820/g.116214  ORF Transcript_48820/g.116214 Transcript_48820/m.116214 type:complete len:265 (+) Transcript_48820:420-1214(+)
MPHLPHLDHLVVPASHLDIEHAPLVAALRRHRQEERPHAEPVRPGRVLAHQHLTRYQPSRVAANPHRGDQRAVVGLAEDVDLKGGAHHGLKLRFEHCVESVGPHRGRRQHREPDHQVLGCRWDARAHAHWQARGRHRLNVCLVRHALLPLARGPAQVLAPLEIPAGVVRPNRHANRQTRVRHHHDLHRAPHHERLGREGHVEALPHPHAAHRPLPRRQRHVQHQLVPLHPARVRQARHVIRQPARRVWRVRHTHPESRLVGTPS